MCFDDEPAPAADGEVAGQTASETPEQSEAAQPPGAERAKSTKAGKGKPAKRADTGAGDESALGPGEIRIRADRQGGEAGHYWFRGFADLATGDARIQADALDLYQSEDPDGRKRSRVEAVGNVVFMRGDERLAGETLSLDLDTQAGSFEQARGFLQPGVFVEGDRIERVEDGVYRISGGRFTACAQPNPRWAFTASSATIELDERIVAKNVVFRVKSVPAFYIPYFVYPIREDQRSTGFLFPHFGHSSERGFNLGTGFFWAMGRSYDQTLYLDNYSRFGWGFGHELRYLGPRPSSGTFRSYAFRRDAELAPVGDDGKLDRWDFDLDWRAIQSLPGGVKATTNVRLFSGIEFQRRIQDSLNLASTRRQRASLNLQKKLGGTTIRALVDSNDTYFGEDSKRVNRHLPSITLTRSRQKLGRTGIVFSYSASADGLARGNEERVDSYSRFDLAPEISRPVALSFLQLTPRIQARYTRYGATYDDAGELTGPGLGRPFLEGSVEMRGPTLSRVFLNEGGFYSEKFKHVIGPEVVWSYRTAVDDFDVIPKFDGTDQLLGTHQVRYALVQSLLAKRPDASGKLVPWEVLSWRLQQTYYVQINDNQNEFDPNYTSSAFGPGGEPDHNSPLLSRFSFRPSRDWTTDFNVEYDVNFKQVRTLSLGTRYGGPRGFLNASWARAYQLAEDPADREKNRDFLRGQAGIEVVPGRLRLEGGADWDIVEKTVLSSRAKLEYDIQCCGFSLEVAQYDFNDRNEREIRFSIQLANIGSMGSFLGGGDSGGFGR